jgi:hypothetical protein
LLFGSHIRRNKLRRVREVRGPSFKDDDPRGAIARIVPVLMPLMPRAASCNGRDVVARVLAVSAALSNVHATLELNAALELSQCSAMSGVRSHRSSPQGD